jgi:hypothetical protein
MQSRTRQSLVISLLLTAVACAYQNAGAGMADDGGGDVTDDGGTSTGGATSKAGTSSLPSAGTQTSTSTAGKGSGGKGGSASGGKSGSSSGGKTSTAGTSASDGGQDPGPVNMPLVGLSVTFKADSTADPVDFIGGELDLINDTAQPLSLADVKVRYYFSNEITAVAPMVMMNWAQFGPKTNLGDATCSGKIEAAESPVVGADSYVELTCTGASSSELTAGTLLKISWKAGAQGQNQKFIQGDDWSFSDPTKIVVLNGSTIVWGIDPS